MNDNAYRQDLVSLNREGC